MKKGHLLLPWMPTFWFRPSDIKLAAAGFDPATKGFFSSRCETILENQEKVNRYSDVDNLDNRV